MHCRFLKICALFLSLTLAVLPMQSAFAGSTDGTADNHCHDDSSALNDQHAVTGKISHCCCDHCDASCGSCPAVISAVLIPATGVDILPSAQEIFCATPHHYTSLTSSPPSPPPLS